MVNGNGMLKKIICGVSVTVIAALIIAVIAVLGTVRVNSMALAAMAPRVERNTATISDMRVDVREIKTIVERIEKRMETQ